MEQLDKVNVQLIMEQLDKVNVQLIIEQFNKVNVSMHTINRKPLLSIHRQYCTLQR